MFKRFAAWLKALFNNKMDQIEDPEIMLDQAKRDMQGALIANRERAVQAIAQKNRLQGMLDDAARKSAQLEAQATMALKQGNRDLARDFLREKATNDSTVETLKATLAQAQETVDSVKTAIKRQEDDVRKKTAEALAMKAQWKQAQIQSSISKALEGLTFENEYEGSFSAARDRIKDKQAEASARQEIMSGSIAGKAMAMEDLAADSAADEQLKALEEKLGLGAPKVQNVTASGSVDDQLNELEKRLQQGNSGGTANP